MNTDEYINQHRKHKNNNIGQYYRGRLLGQLDILEDMHEAHHDHYSCCTSFKKCLIAEDKWVCSLGRKIKKIRKALGIEEQHKKTEGGKQ